jgi:hypothetical protein
VTSGWRTCGRCRRRAAERTLLDPYASSQQATRRKALPSPVRYGRFVGKIGKAVRPDFDALPFRSLYLLDDEWAAEIANQTVHGVLHLGWVSDGLAAIAGRWPFS